MKSQFFYFDISPTVSSRLGVFPGDVAFSRHQSMSTNAGDNITLSEITSTLHLGAHADAPIHYHPAGQTIEAIDVSKYIGRCQVINVDVSRGERIYPHHIKNKSIVAKRILFCTGSFPDPDNWNSDFAALSPELIEYLATKDVVVVGIDTPSVDPQDSKRLESHQALYLKNILPLEGIVLKDVPEGEYILIATPLKIEDADASPVRAILVPLTETERIFK